MIEALETPFHYRVSHYVHAAVIVVLLPMLFFAVMPSLFEAQTGDEFHQLVELSTIRGEIESLPAGDSTAGFGAAQRDIGQLFALGDQGRNLARVVGVLSGLLAGIGLAVLYLLVINPARPGRRANIAGFVVLLAMLLVNVSVVRYTGSEALAAYRGSTHRLDPMIGELTLQAIEVDNLTLARKLMTFSSSLVAGDARGATALHLASERGLQDIAHRIVDAGLQELDTRDPLGATPLMYALRSGRINIATWFLDSGADPGAVTDGGESVLHWATRSGNVSAVALVLDTGADVDVLDVHGKTPLDLAYARGDDGIMTLLLEGGATPDASEASRGVLLRSSVDALVRRASQTRAPLEQSDLPEFARVELLLDHGADPNVPDKNGRVPLHALRAGVEAGELPPVNRDVLSRLANRLIEAGADPLRTDIDGVAAYDLGVATFYGDYERIALLCRKSPDDVDVLGAGGKSPLQTAIEHGDTKAAEILLKAGADPFVWSDETTGPVEAVVHLGTFDLLRVLLDSGRVTPVNEPGRANPIHIAAREGHPELIAPLEKFGYLIDAQDSRGNTPLHLASEGGHVECARILLAHGADPTTWNRKGRTALALAEENGYGELLALLKQHLYERSRR